MEISASAPVRAARPWVRPMARVGYAARGLVYLVIGWLAFLSGIGGGGSEAVDSKGAVQTLMGSGPGAAIAIILILGLLSYALWRLIQAVFDADEHGASAKGAAIRAGLLASGITYLGLTAYTVSLWRGSASESEGAGAFSQWATDLVGGQIAAFLLAAILAGVAIAHFVKAWRRGYEKYLEVDDEKTRKAIAPVAMTGLIARGVIFLVLAVLLFYGGTLAGSGQPGTADALSFIRDLPAGRLLLILVALGLVAFALYSLAEARWRRVDIKGR